MVSTHEPWAGNLNAPFLSTVVEGLENLSMVSPEKIHAVKQYMTELFDYDLQQTLDNWLFEYWHDRIANAGILPLCFGAEDIGKVAVDFSRANPTFDSPFHTDRATQEQVAANIHRKVTDNLPQIK
jgi:hypothetical protein